MALTVVGAVEEPLVSLTELHPRCPVGQGLRAVERDLGRDALHRFTCSHAAKISPALLWEFITRSRPGIQGLSLTSFWGLADVALRPDGGRHRQDPRMRSAKGPGC